MSIIAQKIHEVEWAQFFVLKSTVDEHDMSVVTQEPDGMIQMTCFCGKDGCELSNDGLRAALLEKVYQVHPQMKPMYREFFEPAPEGEVRPYLLHRSVAQETRKAIEKLEQEMAAKLRVEPSSVKALLEESGKKFE